MYRLLAVSGIFKAEEEDIELWPWWGPQFYEPVGSAGKGERAAPACTLGCGHPCSHLVPDQGPRVALKRPAVRSEQLLLFRTLKASPPACEFPPVWGHVRRNAVACTWAPGPGQRLPPSLIFPGMGWEQGKRFLRGQPAPFLRAGGRQDSSGLGENKDPSQQIPFLTSQPPDLRRHTCHCHLCVHAGLGADCHRISHKLPGWGWSSGGPRPGGHKPFPALAPGRVAPGLLVGGGAAGPSNSPCFRASLPWANTMLPQAFPWYVTQSTYSRGPGCPRSLDLIRFVAPARIAAGGIEISGGSWRTCKSQATESHSAALQTCERRT